MENENKKAEYEKCPPIPDYIKEKINEELFPHYLIYRKNKGITYAYCTHCGEYFNSDYDDMGYQTFSGHVSHNFEGKCPVCGARVTEKAAGFVSNLTHSVSVAVPITENFNTVWIRVCTVSKDYGGINPLEPWLISNEFYSDDYIYKFTPGEFKAWEKSWYYGWYRIDKPKEPYVSSYGSRNYYKIVHCGELKNSFLKYALPAGFGGTENWSFRYDDIKYLCFLAKYPSIEYLLKLGFGELVDAAVRGRQFKRVCDISKTNPAEMFECTKQEFAELRAVAKSVDVEFLKIRKLFKEYDSNVQNDLIKRAAYFYSSACSVKKLKDLFKSVALTPKQLIGYLEKQRSKLRDKRFYGWNISGDYFDYIQQCKVLGYSLSDRQILFPSDLLAAHEEFSKRIKYKASCELILACKKRAEKLSAKYGFAKGALFIKVPETTDEIIAEGAALCHCVGSYAERHAKGTTTILFVRKKSEPDKPYYTMEIGSDGSIVQCRGYKNNRESPKPQSVADFEKAFEKFAKAGGNKKQKIKEAS